MPSPIKTPTPRTDHFYGCPPPDSGKDWQTRGTKPERDFARTLETELGEAKAKRGKPKSLPQDILEKAGPFLKMINEIGPLIGRGFAGVNNLLRKRFCLSFHFVVEFSWKTMFALVRQRENNIQLPVTK